MNKAVLVRIIAAILTVLAISVGTSVWPMLTGQHGPLTGSEDGVSSSTPSLWQVTTGISGEYVGQVRLEWILGGVYTDTLSTPTAQPVGTPVPANSNLGSIDLALSLGQSGERLGQSGAQRDCPSGAIWFGYVLLDRTLVFTHEHDILVTPVGPLPGTGTPAPTAHPLSIGPCVQAAVSGSTIYLESERFPPGATPTPSTGVTNAGRRITRQFRLTITEIQNGGDTIKGEYRETIWGYGPGPATVLGGFSLSRPVFTSLTPAPTSTPSPPRPYDKRVYLPHIVRNSPLRWTP